MPPPASTNAAAAGSTGSRAALLGLAAALSVPACVYAAKRLLPSACLHPNRQKAEAKNTLVRQKTDSKLRMSKEERREARRRLKEERLERAYTAACTRREVVREIEVGDVTVREFRGVECVKGVPIVEGFPASGLSSSLAANYLVSELDLPLVGEIVSDAFPALGVVSRYAASSGCRIYGDERLAVFVSDYKIKEEEGAVSVLADIVDAVLDFANRHGSKLIITAEGLARTSSIKKSDYETQEELLAAMLEQMGDHAGEEEQEEIKAAIEERMREAALEKLRLREEEEAKGSGSGSPDSAASGGGDAGAKKKRKSKKKKKKGAEDSDSESDEEPEDGEIRFVCNDSELALRMKALGHRPLREGMLSGVTGGIIARASTTKQTVVCVLSPYDEALPDASATVPIIECIDAILGDDIVIDTLDLEREVRRIERELRKAIEEMVPKSGTTSKDRHMSMYM